MKKDITTLEDLLTDEDFLAAYDGRNGPRKAQWQEWVDWMGSRPRPRYPYDPGHPPADHHPPRGSTHSR